MHGEGSDPASPHLKSQPINPMASKAKLSKSSRLSLIATLCAGGLSGAMVPTKHDMREEAHIITHHQDKGELPIAGDDDLPALPSALIFESPKEVREGMDCATLSASERASLRRDLCAYRIKRDLCAPRNPFALVLVAS